MAQITYANKSFINENPDVAAQYKVSASDMNEIKNVVNNNDNLMGDVSTLSTASTDVVSSINAISKYSTTEQRIGTWVGKPLYRKVFNFGAMPNTASKDITHNISNLGTTIKCYGMAVRTSDSRALSIPDSTPGAEIACGVTNTNVYVTTYSDRSSFNDSHIIIEYTKTTD